MNNMPAKPCEAFCRTYRLLESAYYILVFRPVIIRQNKMPDIQNRINDHRNYTAYANFIIFDKRS